MFEPKPPKGLLAAGCAPNPLAGWLVVLLPNRPPPPKPPVVVEAPNAVLLEAAGCVVPKLKAGLLAGLPPKSDDPGVVVLVPKPLVGPVPPKAVVPVFPNRPPDGCVEGCAPNRPPVAGFAPNRPPPVDVVAPPKPVEGGWDPPNGELVAPPPNKLEPVPELPVPNPPVVPAVVLPNPPPKLLVPKAPG